MESRRFNPKVSIVIPVYNGSDYLREAINSALAQTYSNIEIIVINDGSNDGGATEKIAFSYGDRIRYFSKTNGGVASALNMAIDNMSGEYFSWLSHDDLYFEQKVERQIEFLSAINSEESNNIIVYSDYAHFTNNPDEVELRKMPGVPPSEFRYWLTTENILHGCTLLIPKTAFSRIGRFDTQLRTTQDYDLWFRLAKEYQFVHLGECLVKSRLHPNQGSRTMAALGSVEQEALLTRMVLDLGKDELRSFSKDVVVVAYAQIAKNMWCRGFNQTAWRSAGLSLKNLSVATFMAGFRAISLLARQIIRVYIYDPIMAYPRKVLAYTRKIARKLVNSIKRLSPNRILKAVLTRSQEVRIRGCYICWLIRAMGGKCRGPILVDRGFMFKYLPHVGWNIGSGVDIGKNVVFDVPEGGELYIDDNVKFNMDVVIAAGGRIKIGANSLIGEFVSIRDSDHGVYLGELIASQPLNTRAVFIGDDVWIGRGVAILSGSKIGHGAVIGANAVVRGEIPENMIAVGIPAKPLKIRPSRKSN